VTRASQKRSPLTTSIASSQTTFYSTSPANDFCGTDYPRCLWHSPPTDKVKIHFRKKFFHIYWYVTFSSQMSLNTEMLEVSQTSKGWIQREYVRLGKLFYGFMLYSVKRLFKINEDMTEVLLVLEEPQGTSKIRECKTACSEFNSTLCFNWLVRSSINTKITGTTCIWLYCFHHTFCHTFGQEDSLYTPFKVTYTTLLLLRAGQQSSLPSETYVLATLSIE